MFVPVSFCLNLYNAQAVNYDCFIALPTLRKIKLAWISLIKKPFQRENMRKFQCVRFDLCAHVCLKPHIMSSVSSYHQNNRKDNIFLFLPFLRKTIITWWGTFVECMYLCYRCHKWPLCDNTWNENSTHFYELLRRTENVKANFGNSNKICGRGEHWSKCPK